MDDAGHTLRSRSPQTMSAGSTAIIRPNPLDSLFWSLEVQLESASRDMRRRALPMTAPTTRPTLTPLLLVLLALLSAFTPLSIDMYLPALPTIVGELDSTAGDIQLTLSTFMLAFGFGQIFYGPARDRVRRRPVILSGRLVYISTTHSVAYAADTGQRALLRF